MADSLTRPLSFGKHEGEDIEDIPSDYLRWLLETEWFDKKHVDMVEPIETELEFRDRFDKHI